MHVVLQYITSMPRKNKIRSLNQQNIFKSLESLVQHQQLLLCTANPNPLLVNALLHLVNLVHLVLN